MLCATLALFEARLWLLFWTSLIDSIGETLPQRVV
jgi:hypothetical protein